MKIFIVQINPIVGDILGNTKKIISKIEEGRKKGADLILFSELVISGYPPEDFLLLPHFIGSIENQLEVIAKHTQDIVAIIGTPRVNKTGIEKGLFNSAAVIHDGHVIGYQDKHLLPTYDVFDESRYFSPATSTQIWNFKDKNIAITICEDLWQHSELVKYTRYQRDPIEDLKMNKPDLILNLSASPYSVGKLKNRLAVCKSAASTLSCPILFCNQVGVNDSLIFDGYSLVIDSKAELVEIAKGFEEDTLLIDLNTPFIIKELNDDIVENLYRALVLGVKDYLHKSGFKKCCIGLSGGVDSAVVACIAIDALGKDNVLGLMMPSRYSSEGSINDSIHLVQNLGIESVQVSIDTLYQNYLDTLKPHFGNRPFDSTEENLQARIRGMILMAFSNKLGYIVLSTGNKSEMAMGYATLYGDMCGGLSVLSDVTKVQVYQIARWINRIKEVIPQAIIDKPPSAELRENQKDSDSLPDYAIIDNILDSYVLDHMSEQKIANKFGYDINLVEDLVGRIHRNEYKRRQSAPGLRVSEKSFSIGRRFPIVQKWI